jgi:hypothetical protein
MATELVAIVFIEVTIHDLSVTNFNEKIPIGTFKMIDILSQKKLAYIVG